MKDLETLGNKFRLCSKGQENLLNNFKPGNRLEVVHHQTVRKEASLRY